MLNVKTPYDRHVVSRLLDFFGAKTPWQRSLWNSGIVLTLREALQASAGVAASVVSNSSLHNLTSHAIVLAGRDPGVGDAIQVRVLQEALRTDLKGGGLTFEGVDYRVVAILVAEIEEHYLERWAATVAANTGQFGAERTARAIASHLLDAGFSSGFLHRWWTYRVQHEPGTKDLANIITEAHNIVSAPPIDFELVVGFEHAPPPLGSDPDSLWISNQDLSGWLRSHKFDVAGVRTRGGLMFNIQARDPQAAAERAAETVERLVSRAELGTYKKLVPTSQIWVSGESKPLPLRLKARKVEVHALSRQDRLYNGGKFSQVDAALELVWPLNSAPPSPAVAGGWAAVEALLTGAGDKERVLAGDRMAALVACSFPRAELTELSYRLEELGGTPAAELKACTSNRDRAAVVIKLIKSGTKLKFPADSDNAALARLTAVLVNPSQKLRDVEQHAANAFRRLYRYRNMVLHWGRTDAVGLRACLRTAAPLVGAGLDRIAHAWFTNDCGPLDLAARARIRLDSLGSAAAATAENLLEP